MKKALPLVLLFAVLTCILPLAALSSFHPGKTKKAARATAPAHASPPRRCRFMDGQVKRDPAPQPGTSWPQTAHAPQASPLDSGRKHRRGGGGIRAGLCARRSGGRNAHDLSGRSPAPDRPAALAHSYALAVKAQADPDNEALKGAHFSANPTQRLGYITDTVGCAPCGAQDYEANRTRLYTVVDSVLDEILLYDGQPASGATHAISGGKTEAAEAVWGAAVPYLVSVDSPLDLTSPDHEQTITVTKQEVAGGGYRRTAFPDIVLEGDAAGWFGTPQLTAAGYVDSITIGGVPCKGTAVRAALRLRSASFTITWTEKHLFEDHHSRLRPRRGPEPVRRKRACIDGQELSGDPVPVLPRHHAGPRAPVTPSTGWHAGV